MAHAFLRHFKKSTSNTQYQGEPQFLLMSVVIMMIALIIMMMMAMVMMVMMMTLGWKVIQRGRNSALGLMEPFMPH